MANRIRVYELAKEIQVDSKILISALNEMGRPVKNHMASLDESQISALRAKFAPQKESTPEGKPRSAQKPARSHAQQERPDRALPSPATPKSARPQGGRDRSSSSQRERASNQGSGQSMRERFFGSRGKGDRNDGRAHHGRRDRVPQRQDTPKIQTGQRRVTIQGDTPVRELASLIGVPVAQVLRTFMNLGVLISINQSAPPEIASKVAEKLGCAVTVKEPERSQEELILDELERPDDPEKSVPRPPVVTVMGHVDHGKTSLLDAIRHTNVTAKEAGGITQHIGASVVNHNGNRLIFLDTPGHEAFTAMRARGAKVTDIAVLVVAADDGVMPQSVEAINHAKAAGVPVVVAINKIDKPGAKIDRVKQQLSNVGLVPEDWGGDTVVVPVSAVTREGIEELLEMILLVAEMQEIKTDPSRNARGYIIESQMDKGRGPVATAIVKSGSLRVGDVVITDSTWGKIRAMYDAQGRQVKKAGPATPVEIVGLEELPQAGDTFLVLEDEKMAKDVIEQRKSDRRAQEMEVTHVMTLDELFRSKEEEENRELKVIVKSDVQGSLEAILQALGKVKSDEVKLDVIHSGVGAIIGSDVMLARASSAIILGFNVRPDANAKSMADADKIEIRTYRVIYDLIDDVSSMLKGLTKPKTEEVILGKAEIRQTFHVPKVGTVAGCYVMEGKMQRNSSVRLIRDNVVVYEGRMSSLRRFKDDVNEVSQGYECGIGLERYNDIKPGDVIEAFAIKEVSAS